MEIINAKSSKIDIEIIFKILDLLMCTKDYKTCSYQWSNVFNASFI